MNPPERKRRPPSRPRTLLLSLVFLSGIVGIAAAEAGRPRRTNDPDASLSHFTNHLDRRVPEMMEEMGVPGAALALVRDGDLVWSGAYGYADPVARREMTIDTIFRVESISKSLTAWGVMKLVEGGRIDLDAPVERYLGSTAIPALQNTGRSSETGASHARSGTRTGPEPDDSDTPPQTGSGITIRRLLSHDAGLALGTIGLEIPPPARDSAARYGDRPSLRDTLSREVQRLRPPGTGFAYSNVGFDLLELVIEEVTGRDFAEYMESEILGPLGMRDSGFGWSEARRPLLAVGTDLRGRPVAAYVRPTRASGGLFAPVEDIARFVRAEMSRPRGARQSILSEAGVRVLHEPRVEIPGLFGLVADAYGFGHFVETLPDGRRAVWHGGQGHGWMSHFHAVPESGEGIVILTNSQRSWPLIAAILRDWSRWRGLGPVKMTRITSGVAASKVFTLVMGLVALGQLGRVILGWHRGRRRFMPRSGAPRLLRATTAALGFALLALLAWSASQPYLLVSSIFPATARCAGFALLCFALVLLLSAAMPLLPMDDHDPGLR